MASNRAAEYKRRTLRYGDLQNARTQRLQKLVVARQEQRDTRICNRREGLQTAHVTVTQTAKENIPFDERKKNLMEKLKNFREQKKAADQKRKEEMKKRPPFVVPGIAYHKTDFFAVQKKEVSKTHTAKPASTATGIITRSQVRGAVPAAAKPDPKRAGKKTPHPAANQHSRRMPLAAVNVRESFAPQNFQFRAPAGVIPYQALQQQQLPVAELATLSLNSPVHAQHPAEQTTASESEAHPAENNELHGGVKNEDPDILNGSKDSAVSLSHNSSTEKETNDEAELPADRRDISYFRDLIAAERERFGKYYEQWENVLGESGIPDDIEGSIRSAVGQAKLLDKERFVQFAELIDQCEYKTSEKQIHFTDLDGFWEMINFQVQDVHKKFEQLDKLRLNGWQEETAAVQRKTRPKKQPAAAASKRNGPRSNIRAFIAEAKAKAAQNTIASPLKTPSANRLENLRKSAIKREARKSVFVTEDVPNGENSLLPEGEPFGELNADCEGILGSGILGTVKLEGGVRRSARLLAKTSPRPENSGRRVTLSSRKILSTPSQNEIEGASSSSKSRSGRKTPAHHTQENLGTPAVVTNHPVRRRLHELD